MEKERILIADDDDFIRDILKNILEEFYQVQEASDGQEALDMIRSHNPSLVILDNKMPKKTGIEVCREIREDPLFLHIPIIMLTGKGELQDKIEGLDTGTGAGFAGVTIGFGFNFNIYRFDYGFASFGDLGTTHRFGISGSL